jgi:phosphoglycolate phosphatase
LTRRAGEIVVPEGTRELVVPEGTREPVVPNGTRELVVPEGTRELVVFDLDGTLIDGYAAIADALAYAMRELGAAPLPAERVRGMVGHGLHSLLEQAVGAERAGEGVRLFRERYEEVAVAQTELMPGAAEAVAALGAAGHRMAVASNKPARFSRLILEGRGLASAFFAIAGPDEETPPKPDPTMLRRIMASAGAAPEETVVVGDMEVDDEFARAAGCRVVLIPAGSRTREELSSLRPDAFLESISLLPGWLKQIPRNRTASS